MALYILVYIIKGAFTKCPRGICGVKKLLFESYNFAFYVQVLG